MPLANSLVLFTVEERQKNGQTEVQQNPKLPLVIALPVLVPFLVNQLQGSSQFCEQENCLHA